MKVKLAFCYKYVTICGESSLHGIVMVSKQVIQQTADAIYRRTKTFLVVADQEGRVIITAGSAPKGVLASTLQEFAASERPRDITADRYISRITDQTEPVYIIAAFGTSQAPAVGEEFEVVFPALLQAERGDLNRDDFYCRLTAGRMTRLDMCGCASEFDIEIDMPYVVYTVDIPEGYGMVTAERLLERLRMRIADDVFLYDRTVPVIVHKLEENREEENSGIDELEQKLIEQTRSVAGEGAIIGKSAQISSLDYLEVAYREAREAVRISKIFGYEGQLQRYLDLLLEQIIVYLPKRVCHRLLDIMAGDTFYEQMSGEDLRIAFSFLDHSMNAAKTAREMFFHRNSVNYRLNRIRRVAKLDLRNFRDAFIFKIGWLLYRYLHTNDKKGSDQDSEYNLRRF